jgi:glycosyltransferase involved in cell wall biosynthesis
MPIELVLIDDGSVDATKVVMQELCTGTVNPAGFQSQLISLERNSGKGAAIKEGFKAARGEMVLICDADLSCPIEEFEKFASHISAYPIVIGSRRCTGARVAVPQAGYRVLMGRVYSWLSRVLLRVDVTDFTCGFKLFRRDAAVRLAGLLTIQRWAYDSELLKIATLHRMPIKEVPVVWRNDERTRVSLPSDTIASFRDLLRIVLNSWRGRYDIAR